MKLLSKTILTALSVSALLVASGASAAAPAERGMHKLSDTERQIHRDQWFANVDTNNDGYISEQEFVAMATERAAERAKAAFARLDQNGTGEISAADFAELAEQRSEQAAERRQAMRERVHSMRQGEGKREWRGRGEAQSKERDGERKSKEQRQERR
ncbi:MAG: hypothetical protein JJU03_07275 [Idiomarina sp.]|nr:hypothetical protein [Idiomarina sp.]